jgi:hypothetical protein
MSGFDQRTPTFRNAAQGPAVGVRLRPIVGEPSCNRGGLAADFEDPILSHGPSLAPDVFGAGSNEHLRPDLLLRLSLESHTC